MHIETQNIEIKVPVHNNAEITMESKNLVQKDGQTNFEDDKRLFHGKDDPLAVHAGSHFCQVGGKESSTCLSGTPRKTNK